MSKDRPKNQKAAPKSKQAIKSKRAIRLKQRRAKGDTSV